MNQVQAHIQLENKGICYAILPGDPARIDRVLPHLQQVQPLSFNREYRSAMGRYMGIDVLVLSTGIGGASMGIAVEELHNIGVKAMVRIGSCGSLQPRVHLGDLVMATGAVRHDGASRAYIEPAFPAVPAFALLSACASSAAENGFPHHLGLVRSHDSFYTDNEDELMAYWSRQGILGADMETAALFTIGALRGVQTASILNNVVEYQQDTADSIGQYAAGEDLTKKGEENEIITALEALVKLEEAYGYQQAVAKGGTDHSN